MIKKDLIEISEASNVLMQQTIEETRTQLLEEMRNMLNSEITSVLNNIYLEMKDISKSRTSSLQTRKVNQAVQNLGQGLNRNYITSHEGITRILPSDSTVKSYISQDEKEV